MPNSERDLLGAFFRCIEMDEEFASELADAADRCERAGNHDVAATMRRISRNHRIRGMEHRATLAALTDAYLPAPEQDPGCPRE